MARRIRARLALLCLAALSLLALASSAASASTPAGRAGLALSATARNAHSIPPHDSSTSTLPSADTAFGKFAGENWKQGLPSSMSGRWNVPRIEAGSDVGYASTWIGIQGPAVGSSDNGPFIQVGVVEDRGLTRTGRALDGYYAFFSDTAVGFSAIPLFAVRPGDPIRASLKLRGHRWTVWIRDMRSGGHTLFRTTQEGYGAFNQAEWLQEDATDGATDQALPYPALTTTRFTHLRVNGVTPSPTHLLSAWMNELGKFLGPDAISDDAFTLGPQTISAIGAQYLQLIVPFDRVSDWFFDQADSWTAATPEAETSAVRSGFAQALTQAATQLQSATWPTGVQAWITQLAAQMQAQANYLQTSSPVETAEGIRQWLTGLNALNSDDLLSPEIRGALGLPAIFAAP